MPTRVTYRAYELSPGGAMPDAKKVAMIRAHFPQLRARAESLGLPLASEHPGFGTNTRAAHSAAKLVAARAPDKAAAFHRAVCVAHWVERRDIADRATLGELVAAQGIERAALDEALDGKLYEGAVLADQEEAYRLGFHAVPQLVLNGQPLPPGMLPAEVLVDVARRLDGK